MSTYIIAEAGVNHNGSVELAKELIKIAAEIGANAIKFQTFSADKMVTKDAKKAKYQINPENNQNQYEMLKSFELSEDQFITLRDFAYRQKIDFLCSPFDVDSLKFLVKIGIKTIKVASGEITNLPLLREIAELADKVILSTGMSTMSEIEEAFLVLTSGSLTKRDITILHANSMYPTPLEDVNLNAMITIQKRFGVDVGYSDHTKGIQVPIAACVLGAKVIEKHITLDNSMPGPDHSASLDPLTFKEMISSIKKVEICLGASEKFPSKSEKDNIDIVRKSIVASRNISKGDIFSEANITTKRPGNGISPMMWDRVIGKVAVKNYKPDENI